MRSEAGVYVDQLLTDRETGSIVWHKHCPPRFMHGIAAARRGTAILFGLSGYDVKGIFPCRTRGGVSTWHQRRQRPCLPGALQVVHGRVGGLHRRRLSRSLPGQKHVALEIEFVVLFGEVMHKYANMNVKLCKPPARSSRKITAALRKEVSELRYHVKALDNFWKQLFLRSESSFQPGEIKYEFQPIASSVWPSTSPAWATCRRALTCLSLTSSRAGPRMRAKLVTHWSVQGWELVKGTILNKEQSPMLNNMLDNQNYICCGKCAKLMNNWCQFLNATNHNGCGLIVETSSLKMYSDVVRAATAPDLEDHTEDQEEQLEEGGNQGLAPRDRAPLGVGCGAQGIFPACPQQGSSRRTRKLASNARDAREG